VTVAAYPRRRGRVEEASEVHEDWGSRCERWAGVRSEEVDVYGTAVHALRAGEGREGTPQLLVHGLGGAAINWLEVMPRLAERGPVLAPDLPGFGRTQPPRDRASRVEANARFLRALLDRVGWDQVELHGNSMGGLVSVLFASREPLRVARLVLGSPALTAARRDITQIERLTFVQFAPFLSRGAGNLLLKRLHARLSAEEIYDQSVAYLHADPSRVSPELGRVSLENVHYGRAEAWRLPAFATATNSVVRAVTTRRTVERAVRAVKAPTLVVWGDRDRLIGRPVIDRLAELRPDWHIEVLDGVGHVAIIEVPDRYLEVVDAWRDGLQHAAEHPGVS
jgi:pimeloyl-ACP methyl ester carboxylesterase